MTEMQKRTFLKLMLAGAAYLPLKLLAAWNKPAFDATTPKAALDGLGAASEIVSDKIEIIAPNYAENGAVVQIEVKSHIPNSEAIAILVDKNPTSLIANFMFSNGAQPHVVTRIKMAETSEVRAIVKVGTQYFTASKLVEVSVGGCG